jgi:transmembrane sensor
MSALDRQAVARDEAAVWLVSGARPDDVEQTAEFRHWLSAAPQNAEAWTAARSLWSEFDASPDLLMSAMLEDARSAQSLAPRPVWIGMALAASLVAAVGLGWTVLGSHRPGVVIPSETPPTFAASAVTTYTLADGTRATLDAGAAMVVTFDARQRAVRLLRGRAYLAIAPDPRRPFLTEAADRTIRDLGTEFGVAVQQKSVEVILTKGKVAVSSANARTDLSPGQRLRTSPHRADQIDQVPLDQTLGWRQPNLEFHGQPLEAVVAEINRYGGPPARIADPRVANLKVGGSFKAGDPTRFATLLVELYPLALRSRPDGGVDIHSR